MSCKRVHNPPSEYQISIDSDDSRAEAAANDTEFQYSHSVRPVERAAAHKRKKALKKALPEDVGADALRGPPCSAHLSG